MLSCLVGDSRRADEIVQETLIRLWQRPRLLDQPATRLRSWLFTVARNSAYDDAYHRRATTKPSPLSSPSHPAPSTSRLHYALLALRHACGDQGITVAS